MPYSKAHGRPQECNGRVYSERIRLIMGQVGTWLCVVHDHKHCVT